MYLIICTRVVTFVQLSLKKRNIDQYLQSDKEEQILLTKMILGTAVISEDLSQKKK